MSTELKPCPFCGSKSIDEKGWASTDSAGPACDDCGAGAGGVNSTLAENIAHWNTRAQLLEWLPMDTAPKDGTPVLLSIRWEDEPVLAKWLGDRVNAWHICTQNIRIDGDASIENYFEQGEILGWFPVPTPKWHAGPQEVA